MTRKLIDVALQRLFLSRLSAWKKVKKIPTREKCNSLLFLPYFFSNFKNKYGHKA
jgi:hypothetical protein